MKKLMIGFFAAVVAAVSSFAETPLAYWDQDFTGADTASGAAPKGGSATDGAKVTFASGSHTLAADAKSITVGESIVGVKARLEQKLTLAAPDGGLTVMIAYSDFPAVGETLPTAIGDFINDSDLAALVTCPAGLVRYDKGTTVVNEVCGQPGWSAALDLRKLSVSTFAPASGVTNLIAASYDRTSRNGPRFFTNDGDGWTLLSEGGLSSGSYSQINGFTIGGFYSANNRTGTFAPATGMKIHSIAIFKGALSADQLADWEFPSRQKKDDVNLKWTDAESGVWSATKFGTVDYLAENFHTVDFTDNPDISREPVTVTVEGAHAVTVLKSTASLRDFTLTGDAITTPELKKTGSGAIKFENEVTVSGPVEIAGGSLAFAKDTIFTPERFGSLKIGSAATLLLEGASFISNTNFPSLYSAPSDFAGTISLSDESVMDIVVTNKEDAVTMSGNLAGTGTVNLYAKQTAERNIRLITWDMSTIGFTGVVNMVVDDDASAWKETCIAFGSGTSEKTLNRGRPELNLTSLHHSYYQLQTSSAANPFCVRNLSGNGAIRTNSGSPGTERCIDIELTKDCTFSGYFNSDSYRRYANLIVRAGTPDYTWTLAGANANADATLTVTESAKVAIASTGAWSGPTVVDTDATLEIRRDADSLKVDKPLTVNGTLCLVGQDGVPSVKGDTITFGSDSKLSLTIPDGFLSKRENRKVQFPIVQASSSLVIPEAFEPEIPSEARLVRIFADDGVTLVGLAVEYKNPGLMLILR